MSFKTFNAYSLDFKTLKTVDLFILVEHAWIKIAYRPEMGKHSRKEY